jgi:ribosomal protein S18 acetylase RimI-like enzyme
MSSFALHNNGLGFCAFGQIYERYSRINLARLVVHPERRGRGIGRQLVTMLLEAGPSIVQRDEFSLFVYRDKTPALKCYQALGFSIQDYPADEPLASEGYYLTRPRLP